MVVEKIVTEKIQQRRRRTAGHLHPAPGRTCVNWSHGSQFEGRNNSRSICLTYVDSLLEESGRANADKLRTEDHGG